VFALPFRAMEMLYDILCHWRGVKKELSINMPNNYPAHLSMLERHLGIHLPMEILYHMCRMCGHVFRLATKGAATCICGHSRHWPGTNRPQQVFVYRCVSVWVMVQWSMGSTATLMTCVHMLIDVGIHPAAGQSIPRLGHCISMSTCPCS
jgi:hypothetical protein